MKRALTFREKLLLAGLLVVVLFAGYFKLFFQPMQERLTKAEEKTASIQENLDQNQAKLAQMKQMETELEKLKNSGKIKDSRVPEYDHIDQIMVELGTILKSAQDYHLEFSDLKFEDQVVVRPIKLTFQAENYDQAKRIFTNLYQLPDRCDLSEITVTTGNDETQQGDIRKQKVSVELRMNFYEKKNADAEKAEARAAQQKSENP